MNTAPSKQNTTKRTATASTFKPRVRRLGPGRYLVESASRPGVGHPVTVDHCNCTGFSYRGTCRHIALVKVIEPKMQAWYDQATTPAWYDQATTPACPTVEEEHADGTSARGTTMVANTIFDAQLAEAEWLLAVKRLALADAHPQDDSYATLLRDVDQAERQVAALSYSAMRVA